MLVIPLLVFAVSNRYLNPVSGIESPLAWVHRTRSIVPDATAAGWNVVRLAVDAVGEYLGGSVFYGFWFGFGFRGGHYFSQRTFGPIFQAVTVVGIASFFMAERLIWKRISFVARAFGWSKAVCLLVADHPVNLYIVTTAMLISAHVLSNGALELEGRYWCAMLLPLALVTLRSIPRPLPRVARRVVTIALAGVMAAYSLTTSAVAVRAMNADFYGHRRPQHESVADILELRSAGASSNQPHLLDLRQPQGVRISGYAIDMLTGFAAKNVYVQVDGRKRIAAAQVGLPYLLLAQIMNDDRVAATQFVIHVPARSLAVGRNRLRLFVGNVRGGRAIPFWRDAWVVVAPKTTGMH